MKSLGNDGGDNLELIVIIISRTQMDWKWQRERERKYDKQSFCWLCSVDSFVILSPSLSVEMEHFKSSSTLQ